jgi:RNA polymerase sigma-70 factor, ECF subfamily
MGDAIRLNKRLNTVAPSGIFISNLCSCHDQDDSWKMICRGMPATPPDSNSIELPLPVRAAAALSFPRSDLESEVISLFDQLRNPLLRYVLSIGIRVQEAEEIVQDVFLSLYRHLRLGRPRTNLRGWVFRVAHNLALKQREASRRHPGSAAGADGAALERRCDPAPDPEEQVVRGERRKRLLAVLRALPEQDQACLYLRAEGLRYREIADVLGISLGSVSISLTRSLARLQRADGATGATGA